MEEDDIADIAEDEYLVERNILLRNYQLDLLEQAKTQNSIIYLPTGSGKTLIAIHLLCSRANEIKKPLSEGGKRAFFLTVTKVITHQIAECIKTSTKFKIAFLTGDMNVDCWESDVWMRLIEETHVVILTGEILKVCLQLNYIPMSSISLLVLDEVHHAVGDHPYSLVLQIILNSDSKEKPLILGLSSVLLSSTPNLKQVKQNVKCLESLINGKVITGTNLQEIMSFAANPTEKYVIYQRNNIGPEGERILKMYDHLIESLDKMAVKAQRSPIIPEGSKDFKNRFVSKRIKKLVVKSKVLFEDMGFFCGSLSALLLIVTFEKMKLMSTNPLEVQILIYAATEMIKLRYALQKEMGEEESVASLLQFSSDKVRKLVSILKSEGSRNKKFAGLVFVYQRITAVVLSELLKKLSIVGEEYSFLKPEFVVSSTNFEKENRFLELSNVEIINKFGSLKYNVLVATNILEEGLDVSSCNVVLSYDFPLGYPSYFQSRGRARNKESLFYIFIPEDELDRKTGAIQSFKNIEKELLKSVVEDFSEDEECSTSTTSSEETLRIKSEMRVIDGITAIKILHRYCGKLVRDKFGSVSPVAWYTQCNGMKKAFIQLPMNCPYRDVIEGEPKATIKRARRSVFLRAVKILYDLNELDESLSVRSYTDKVNAVTHLFPHYKEENIDKNLPQPGTSKNRRKYKTKFSESLSGCMPRPGEKAYLHVINLIIEFDKPELKRRIVVHETLQSPVTFALITSKKLFKILRFPIFLDIGQINCDLLVNYEELFLTETELHSIKQCHLALFQKVTKILKNFQVFDCRNKENSFFVVPVLKNSENRFVINWDIIQCDFCRGNTSALVRYNPCSSKLHKMSDNKAETANTSMDSIEGRLIWGFNQDCEEDKSSKFVMTETDYKYFVIYPNYRNQEFPQRYIVDKVCHDMSPLSPFPRVTYDDYIEYYKKNYMVDITNDKQPLLQVSPIYNCSNFNKPSKRNLAKEKFKTYEEHLVPELCDVIPFDRTYFLKALLLPTVLNRIYHVYCVEEFRRKLVTETGLGLIELPEGANWAPLESVVNLIPDEKSEDGNSIMKDLKCLLPLAKLKDQTQANQKVLLDPERHLTEIGLCDTEFFVSSLSEFDEQDLSFEAQLELQKNEEADKLMEMRNIAIPPLKLLCRESRRVSGPNLALLIQACTATTANDIFDYERLEILGDSFLKFSTTLFLFRNYEENEGFLTALKGKIVGNRNLYYCAVAKGFTDVINTNDFAPLFDWNPPLICVPEKLMDEIVEKNLDPAVIYRFEIPPEEQFSGVMSPETLAKNEELFKDYETCYTLSSNSLFPYKVISDKVVSDCVEAFIGAYLMDSGIRGAFTFLSWLDVLPSTGNLFVELMEKPYEDTMRAETHANVMCFLKQVFYSELESTLSYTFKNKALLLEALTHPSYQKNRITTCYERLEMLGDAVLDFLITSYIYEYCGNLSPGKLTDLRSALVNNLTFACITVRYELHKYLLSFNSTLSRDINNFVQFQKARNHVVDDNVLILLEENDYSIVESVTVPKALGDVFESLAGAIYLDSGNSLEVVWKVFYVMMKREIDEFSRNVPKTPVRLIHEISNCKPSFESKVVRDDTVMVECLVYFEGKEIKGYGFGSNKKNAKCSAARATLNKILAPKDERIL